MWNERGQNRQPLIYLTVLPDWQMRPRGCAYMYPPTALLRSSHQTHLLPERHPPETESDLTISFSLFTNCLTSLIRFRPRIQYQIGVHHWQPFLDKVYNQHWCSGCYGAQGSGKDSSRVILSYDNPLGGGPYQGPWDFYLRPWPSAFQIKKIIFAWNCALLKKKTLAFLLHLSMILSKGNCMYVYYPV